MFMTVTGEETSIHVEDSFSLLAGLPDHSGGRALRYFADLNEADRELVQDYAEKLITPFNAANYISDLAKKYAVIDPARRNATYQQDALEEVKRIKQYVALFQSSGDYFPAVQSYTEAVTDEGGRAVDYISVDA